MKKILIITFLFSNYLFAASNYQKLTGKINYLVKQSKHLQAITIGSNDTGEFINAVVYTGSGDVNTNHLVVGTHHGNEDLSAELAYKFIQKLSSSGDRYFKNKKIFIIPVLNISGFNTDEREELNSSGISIDPNRDYPDPCITKINYRLKSTFALANFTKQNNIIGAITIHGYYGSLTYPWGIYTDNYQTLDHELFKSKAQDATILNNYVTGTHADILYPAGGAFEDWAYYELGVWSLLVELENQPNYDNDVSMLISTLDSFPQTRSSQHGHTGRCAQKGNYGISRP